MQVALTPSRNPIQCVNSQSNWIVRLNINVRRLIKDSMVISLEEIKSIGGRTSEERLRCANDKLCEQFSDLFRPEWVLELEVKFKSNKSSVNHQWYRLPFRKI